MNRMPHLFIGGRSPLAEGSHSLDLGMKGLVGYCCPNQPFQLAIVPVDSLANGILLCMSGIRRSSRHM